MRIVASLTPGLDPGGGTHGVHVGLAVKMSHMKAQQTTVVALVS